MLNQELTKNFSLHEFIESRFYNDEQQVDVWEEFIENKKDLMPYVQELADNLQVLRDVVGEAVHINISFRPVWWEHMNGRSGTSQHCLGKAADIVVNNMTPDYVADTIELLIESGDMKQGGVGRYGTFTHYDIRGYKARWNYK